MQPLISIITPNYNCGRFIAQTIESVLAQTYRHWEMLIVDDCSTDNSYQIALEYSQKDTRIKVFQNEKNSGAAVSRNKAIELSQGEYLAFLDSDDLWLPEKLEKQLNFMKKNNFHFSYTNFEHIDEVSQRLNIFVSGPKVVSKRMLYKSNYLGCLTVMYDQKYVGKIQICEQIKKRNDHALWLKVINKTNCCYLLDEPLAKYRKRINSMSSGSVFKLLKYHYLLYRVSEGFSFFKSCFYTLLNLLYGFLRKKIYTEIKGE